MLIDEFGRFPNGLDLDIDRIGNNIRSEFDDGIWHGGREEERLSIFGKMRHDLVEWQEETHVAFDRLHQEQGIPHEIDQRSLAASNPSSGLESRRECQFHCEGLFLEAFG